MLVLNEMMPIIEKSHSLCMSQLVFLHGFMCSPRPWHCFRTQCASIAHSDGFISNIVRHCHNLHARKKIKKQQQILWEVVVPISQVKLSMNNIDKDIIVFDGGYINTPPIRPPDGMNCCSIQVHDLYIVDEVNGDMGLTFPRINGALPFICLPWSMALDIIGQCGLVKYTMLVRPMRNSGKCLSFAARRSVYLQTTGSKSHMHMWDLRFQEIVRLFWIMHLSWRNSLNIIGTH